MRTHTKVLVATTLSIGTLLTSAIVATAGSNGSGGTAPAFSGDGSTTGGSSGAFPGGGGSPGFGGGWTEPGGNDPTAPRDCGEQIGPGTGPDTTISYTPCPGDEPPDPTPIPAPLVPTSGMTGVRPIGWDTSSVGDDGRSITLVFYTGIAPCYVLDHVDVAYGADSVTITLFQGSDPNAGDVACIDIAVLASTTVTLDQPLDGRRIVDGAEG